MEKLLIAPFTKVDAENRVVSGYATLEVPDKTTPIPEVVDYESAKAAFGQWIGNIREMHLPIAVGKAIEIVPDDEKRGIYVSAKISRSRDGEDAWTKIQEGVLTAFSIGMKGLKRSPEVAVLGEKKLTVNRIRFQDLAEVSLVDNPACPGTFFDAVKAAMPEEPTATATADSEKKDVDPNVGGGVDRDKLPASDFIDPERRRFPIVTPGDVEDAVSSYGRAKPRIPFATFKRRLTAIAKRKGAEFEAKLPENWKDETKALMPAGARLRLLAEVAMRPEAAKCQACDIHQALDILHMLCAAVDSESMEQAMGEENADDLDLLVEAFERVIEFVQLEFGELLEERQAPGATDMGMAVQPEETKVEIPEAVKAALDAVQSEIRNLKSEIAQGVKADLVPLSEGVQQAAAAAEAVKTDLAALATRVERLEHSPAPGGPVLRPQDLAGKSLVVAEKGGAPGGTEQARAILADLSKRIDEARDPHVKQELGLLYGQLCLKYGIRD